MRTYKRQLADLLRRSEYKGWTGQVTHRGYPSADRGEVVAELFGANGQTATYFLIRPNGEEARGK